MNSQRDPDEVYGWSGFSPADPACLVALLAACSASGADVRRFEFVPEIQGVLSVDELQRYADHFLERGEVFYSRVALEDWEAWLERMARARGLMPLVVELGVAEAGCVEVLDDVIQRGGAIAREVTPVPEDLIEPSDREIWPDVVPDLPLRGAMVTMDLIGARARSDAPLANDPSLARECLSSLRSAEVLRVFEDASRRSLGELDEDPTRDRTLMDALAIRELAGELYALTGDDALLREIERVDMALDAPERINALFAVSASRWWTDHDRAPSRDHWWGVRTDAEASGLALVRWYGRSGRAVASSAVTPIGSAVGVRDPGTLYQPTKRSGQRGLADVISLDEARRLVPRWEQAMAVGRRRRLPAPRSALAASDPSREVENFVWAPSEGTWSASLNRLTGDDTAWELRLIGAPSATRVVLCDIERELVDRRARFSYAELVEGRERAAFGLAVLAVEISGEWALALLPMTDGD